MDITRMVIAVLAGYLFGCIQAAYFVGKAVKKIDIRSYGSKNAGASNVTTVLGWKYGVITGVIDILKATAAVLIIRAVFPGSTTLLFTTGAFVIVGHVFPAFLGFRGGKGAASFIGMLIAVDIRLALISALILIGLTVITDYISVGSMAMFTVLPITVYYFKYPPGCIIICILLVILCFYKHSVNIKRLIEHQETGLRGVVKKHQRKAEDNK